MQTSEFFEFKPVGRKGVLKLKPPDLYVNKEMCTEFTGFLETFPLTAFDGLVITGGKHFGFGAKVEQHFPGEVETMLPAFHNLLIKLARFKLPVVAAIHGYCLGGVLEIARSCRRVIGLNPESLVIGLPEISLACFPPFGIVVGPRITMDLDETIRFLLTGRMLKCGNADDLVVAKIMGWIDDTFIGSIDDLVAQLDFNTVTEQNVPDRIMPATALDKARILAAMESVPTDKLSTSALEITIKTMVCCSRTVSFEETLKSAEIYYHEYIVPMKDYTTALKAFVTNPRNPQPKFEATGLPT